jgi:hypothetical protein
VNKLPQIMRLQAIPGAFGDRCQDRRHSALSKIGIPAPQQRPETFLYLIRNSFLVSQLEPAI